MVYRVLLLLIDLQKSVRTTPASAVRLDTPADVLVGAPNVGITHVPLEGLHWIKFRYFGKMTLRPQMVRVLKNFLMKS